MPVGTGGRQNRQSAWCRTGCLPESRAVPASPCRSYGNRCAVPPAQANAHLPTGQVTHLPDLAVVPPHLDAATASTRCFFDRRFKVTMRTFGSPKTPRTTGSARHPSNEYVSQSRRRRFDGLAIHKWCQILNPAKMQNIPEIPRSVPLQPLKSTHSIPRRSHFENGCLIKAQCRRAEYLGGRHCV